MRCASCLLDVVTASTLRVALIREVPLPDRELLSLGRAGTRRYLARCFNRLVIGFVLGLGGASSVFADDPPVGSPFPTVSVDLNAAHMVGTLSFDVPIRITGSVGATVNRLELTVSRLERPPSKPKPGATIPRLCDTPTTQVIARNEWTRVTGLSGDTFSIVVPALEPNAYYCFNFVIRRDLSAEEHKSFAATAELAIRSAFDVATENGLTDAQAGQLRLDLAEQIKATSSLPVTFRPNTFFDPRLQFSDVRARMSAAVRPLVTGHRNALLRERDLSNIVIRHQPQFSEWLGRVTTSQFLRELQAAAIADKDFAKIIEPYQPVIKTVLSWQPADATRLLAGRADSGADPGGLDWTGARVKERIASLRSTITTLTNARELVAAFIDRQGGTRQTTVSEVALRAIRDGMSSTISALDAADDELEGIEVAIAQREQGMKAFIDFVRVEAESSSTVFATSVAEFSTRHAQYVSMDLGVGFVPAFDEAFTYVGLNLYLRPVNKEAPLRGWQFKRRFALMGGMTLSGNLTKSNERFSLLGDRMVVAGAGLRFIDSLRVVGGGMFFLKDDPNPIVTKKEWGWSPFMAVTIDWDVRSVWERATGAKAPQ